MTVDANDSIQTNPTLQVTTVTDTVQNKDPLTDNQDPSRVPQQKLISTAVQNRFVNIIGQTPLNVDGTSAAKSISINLGDGAGASQNNLTTLNFQFTGSTTDMVFVKLSTTIYIGAITLANVYGFGSNVNPNAWSFERIPTAHFLNPTNTAYTLNDINQDTEQLVMKNFTGSPQTVTVYYYWRAIFNSGGTKVN